MFIPYIICSNEHAAYRKPGSHGYTTDIELAGRYSREEAVAICDNAGSDRFGHITLPNAICFMAPECHLILSHVRIEPAPTQVTEMPDVVELEPSDEDKDKAICEQCGGTGRTGSVSCGAPCWWCEGRGYRL